MKQRIPKSAKKKKTNVKKTDNVDELKKKEGLKHTLSEIKGLLATAKSMLYVSLFSALAILKKDMLPPLDFKQLVSRVEVTHQVIQKWVEMNNIALFIIEGMNAKFLLSSERMFNKLDC